MQQEEKETEVDMTNRNGRKVKKLLKIIGGLLAIVLLAVIGYVAYVFLSYDRIEDRQALEINQPKASKKDFQSDFVNTGKTYTVGTYNVGFGAYLPDYSFFMDGGEYSRCYSGESGAEHLIQELPCIQNMKSGNHCGEVCQFLQDFQNFWIWTGVIPLIG